MSDLGTWEPQHVSFSLSNRYAYVATDGKYPIAAGQPERSLLRSAERALGASTTRVSLGSPDDIFSELRRTGKEEKSVYFRQLSDAIRTF